VDRQVFEVAVGAVDLDFSEAEVPHALPADHSQQNLVSAVAQVPHAFVGDAKDRVIECPAQPAV